MSKRLGEIAYITKLAGFEHTNYIQGNCSHTKENENYIPLFIGKTVRDGKIDLDFDWYISKDISDSLERSKLTKKCIVLPYVGTVGDMAIFDGTYPAHLGSNIAKIELNEDCSYTEEYIYYFLKSPYGQKILLKDIQGAIQKNITMGAIRDVELPDISKSNQEKIVSILKVIDDKIENNNSINTELESMAKTLYDYWFLQFEFPNEEGKPYKSSGGEMVWNEELKREIPEGWSATHLNRYIGRITNGLNPRKNFILGSGNNYYVTIKSLTGNDINWEACDKCDNEALAKINARSQLQVGDVIFSAIGTIGRTFYIQEEPKNWNISETSFTIRPDNDVPKDFFYSLLKCDEIQIQADKKAMGSTLRCLVMDTLCQIPYVDIPQNVMKEFANIVNPLYSQMFNLNQENRELFSLRDFLIPLLMNGQVGFKEEQ